jgi:hypothetical protein
MDRGRAIDSFGDSKVTRIGAVLASLVASLPAAVLSVLIIVAFLRHADSMSGTLLGLSAVTLLASALIALLPVGIFLFTPNPEAAAGAAAAEAPDEGASEEGIEAAVAEGDEFEEGFDFDEDRGSAPTIEEIASDEFAADEGEDFDLGDVETEEAGFAESEDDFDFEFDDEK